MTLRNQFKRTGYCFSLAAALCHHGGQGWSYTFMGWISQILEMLHSRSVLACERGICEQAPVQHSQADWQAHRARLLAMSWNHHMFNQKCSSYLPAFSFHRRHQEPMNSFLVREALGYSEFTEAILRLHEEKLGIRQEDKDFGDR